MNFLKLATPFSASNEPQVQPLTLVKQPSERVNTSPKPSVVQKQSNDIRDESKRMKRIRSHAQMGALESYITIEGVRVNTDWCIRAVRFYEAQETSKQYIIAGMPMSKLKTLVDTKTK